MISVSDLTDEEIRTLGLEAVRKELGTSGLFRFLRQFGLNTGNYSVERHEWLEELSLSDILKQVGNARQKPSA